MFGALITVNLKKSLMVQGKAPNTCIDKKIFLKKRNFYFIHYQPIRRIQVCFLYYGTTTNLIILVSVFAPFGTCIF